MSTYQTFYIRDPRFYENQVRIDYDIHEPRNSTRQYLEMRAQAFGLEKVQGPHGAYRPVWEAYMEVPVERGSNIWTTADEKRYAKAHVEQLMDKIRRRDIKRDARKPSRKSSRRKKARRG